jgi:hypothetical protein
MEVCRKGPTLLRFTCEKVLLDLPPAEFGQLLVSRLTGKVRTKTHFSGERALIRHQSAFTNGSVYFPHGTARITGLNKHFV